MAAMRRTVLDGSQELGAPSGSPPHFTAAQVLVPSSAIFLGAEAGIWKGKGSSQHLNQFSHMECLYDIWFNWLYHMWAPHYQFCNAELPEILKDNLFHVTNKVR